MIPKPTPQAFNNRVLIHFNTIVYTAVLTQDHIIKNEIAVTINSSDGEKTAGYILKKDLKQYFLQSSLIEKLPIRIKHTKRFVHAGNVLHYLIDPVSIIMPESDELSFRELIDGFCNFIHTNPTHFTLAKIMFVAGYVSRVNYRLATPFGFGKDSIIDALRDLTDNCARIDKATFAKLEYVLRFPFIVCNEVAGLTPTEKKEFEGFGLSAGAFANKYTKRSRKSKGTKEIYDISKLSLGFTYNIAKYYREIGRESFDDAFPKQFLNRFLPAKMDGYIDVAQFKKDGEMDFVIECKKNMDFYKAIIQKLTWLINHPPKPKYVQKYQFNKREGRWERSFDTICLYISLYAKDKSEFVKLTAELYKCYKSYQDTEIKPELEGLKSSEDIVK